MSDSRNGLGVSDTDKSVDETSGVGDNSSISAVNVKGILCGNGDISIMSMFVAGDEDKRGGVVIVSSANSLSASRSCPCLRSNHSYHVVVLRRTVWMKIETCEA
jgi:hypothetical protein